jgi:hypothetical protein
MMMLIAANEVPLAVGRTPDFEGGEVGGDHIWQEVTKVSAAYRTIQGIDTIIYRYHNRVADNFSTSIAVVGCVRKQTGRFSSHRTSSMRRWCNG